MCLSIPAQIIKINKNKALVKKGQEKKLIDISLLKGIKIKDWVLCANNLAIQKIPAEEAKKIFKLINGKK